MSLGFAELTQNRLTHTHKTLLAPRCQSGRAADEAAAQEVDQERRHAWRLNFDAEPAAEAGAFTTHFVAFKGRVDHHGDVCDIAAKKKLKRGEQATRPL